MLYTYLPMLLIGLFALVALLSLLDAVFAQPAPPTVVVQLSPQPDFYAVGTIALLLVLGVLVLLMLLRA